MTPDTKQNRAGELENWASEGYDGPQPWNHDELGISRESRDDLEPGQPNNVTPRVSHSYPILTSGSADPVVHVLGRKLGELGFPNSVSEGRNPFGAVDESVLAAVDAFRGRYGVEEDPTGFGGNTPGGRRNAQAHIGPWTVEGILRAHEREQQNQR